MNSHTNPDAEWLERKISGAMAGNEWYRALGLQNALLFKRAANLLERQKWHIAPPTNESGNQKYRRAWNEVVDAVAKYAGKRGYDNVFAAAMILEALANLEEHLARLHGEEPIEDAVARLVFAGTQLGNVEVLTRQYMRGDIKDIQRSRRKRQSDSERMTELNKSLGRGAWHDNIFVLIAREQYCDQLDGKERADGNIHSAAAERLDKIEQSGEWKDGDAIRMAVSRKWDRFGKIKIVVLEILGGDPEMSDIALIAETRRLLAEQQ